MKWYTGSIVEAVAHAQAKKSLFCVAIFGDDDPASTTLQASLESSEVQAIVVAEGVVAVRIGSGSEEFQQFGAIYPNVSSPSIYCITTGGVAVQVIAGAMDPTQLKSRFDVAINLHREAIVLTSTSGPSPSVQTRPLPGPTEPATSASMPSSSSVQTTPFAGPPPDAATSSNSQTQSTLEERIERAKQLAAAKQRVKREEEAEEAKRRETERREAGKSVAELKRRQEEQETKRLAEERRKDKQEEAALRKRLREQIAQDRIDRETRANSNQAASSAVPVSTATPSTKAESTPSAPVNYTGLARLQFRLPDGSSHTHAFVPETTLSGIIAYLSTSVAVPPQGFGIWVAFPRRELSSSENGSTLRDLGLLPSAALLIIPNADGRILPRVGAGAGGVYAMLSTALLVLLSPLIYIWNMIRPGGTPTGQPQNPGTQRPGPSRRPMGSGTNAPGGAETGATSGGQDASLRNRGRPGRGEAETRDKSSSGESFGRTEGNIRRFHTSNSDSDDEQGTYNGNSTQQM